MSRAGTDFDPFPLADFRQLIDPDAPPEAAGPGRCVVNAYHDTMAENPAGSIRPIHRSRTPFILMMAAALLGLAAGLPGREGSPWIQDQSIENRAVPAGRKAESVAVIPIHGPIDNMTLVSLERRLEVARDRGADAVVLELDTPGGSLDSTFRILELVRTEAPPNTVAWVRPKAFSAGTIIALATREIITTPTGVFGDAAPIQAVPLAGLQQLPAAERAKIEAPLLSELVSDARRQGWDEKLVQAFVAVDVELWLIRNRSTGERLFVDSDEYERIYGEPPVSTKIKRLPAPPARDEDSGLLKAAAKIQKGEAPGTIEERDVAIEFVQELPSQRPVLGPEDAKDWIPLGQVISSEELLVLRSNEAIAYGFSSGEVADEQQLQAFFGAAGTFRIEETWSEGLVRFLTLWPVRAVLIAVLLIGFFIEMAAPGYGVFGLIAAVSLAILLGAPLLAGLSEWWTVLAVIIGLGLVAIELFLVPGLGAPGIIGGVLMFAGLVGTFVTGDPFSPEVRMDLFRGLTATTVGFLGAGVGIWIAWRFIPGSHLGSKFILAAEIGSQTGRSARKPRHDRVDPIKIGTIGNSETPLRTSGRVKFGERLVDARTTGAFIERDVRVRVVESDRFGVVVEIANP